MKSQDISSRVCVDKNRYFLVTSQDISCTVCPNKKTDIFDEKLGCLLPQKSGHLIKKQIFLMRSQDVFSHFCGNKKQLILWLLCLNLTRS